MLDERLLINTREIEMTHARQYKWPHCAKQSKYGCKNDIDNIPRFIQKDVLVQSFHHDQ